MNPNPTAADWSGSRGEKWSAQVTGMEATLAPIDAPLVDALRLDAPLRVADVACGGGGTTLRIAARAPVGSVVDGFDISPHLVESARARVGSSEAGRISFNLADVSKALPEPPYDRLASRFGTMFFDDPPAAFANLSRWLVPGGRFAFAVWATQSDNPWIETVRDAVARVAPVPAFDPDGPGPFRYADVTKLTSLLAAAGLEAEDVVDVRTTLPIGGGLAPNQAAQFALAAMSSFGELLASAGEAAATEAHRALSERYAAHLVDGVVRLPARVHLVVGSPAR